MNRWILLAAVLLFVTFLVIKSRIALFRDPELAASRKRLGEARALARSAKDDRALRAKAYREAATIALDELGRSGLAASYARRADRADPEKGQSLKLLSRAMTRAGRHRGLEKLLWRRLDEVALDSERAGHLMDELVTLYEGPLRRHYTARVLRTLWASRTASSEVDSASGKEADT